MSDKTEQAKSRWAARRGMLELDLILGPYVEHGFPAASRQEQSLFMAFMQCNDQDLYRWLIKKEAPDDEWVEIVQVIIDAQAASRD